MQCPPITNKRSQYCILLYPPGLGNGTAAIPSDDHWRAATVPSRAIIPRRKTHASGGASVYTVNQNGTFLGDWTDGGPWGPTQFTGGAGTFSVQNSVNGASGSNPWWNTPLGVVRIDDAVSSLTVNCSQIRGDGISAPLGARRPPRLTASRRCAPPSMQRRPRR